MGGGVVFRPIIRSHQCPRAPIKFELFLIDAPIALMYNAPISTLAAEDMTDLIMDALL